MQTDSPRIQGIAYLLSRLKPLGMLRTSSGPICTRAGFIWYRLVVVAGLFMFHEPDVAEVTPSSAVWCVVWSV